MPSNNVDSILVPREQAMLNNKTIPSDPLLREDDKKAETEEIVKSLNDSKEEAHVSDEPPKVEETPKEEETQELTQDKETKKEEKLIDEYGNPLKKSKTYTEEEVYEIVKDRISRIKQPIQQQPQHAPQSSQTQPGTQEGEENWEAQLETFIERTLEKKTAKQQEEAWRAQEAKKQAEFEVKFTQGMNKYDDFHEVVAGKLTEPMMLSVRNMENPASFIYAAAKLQPKELERIANIQDRYAQAVEMGALRQKMIKARNNTTSAPKPVEVDRGDLPYKGSQKLSIDQMIAQHEKRLLDRRRGR